MKYLLAVGLIASTVFAFKAMVDTALADLTKASAKMLFIAIVSIATIFYILKPIVLLNN
jgi:hypothetical protein